MRGTVACVLAVLVLVSAGCGRKSKRDQAAAERMVEGAMRMATGQKTDVDVSGETVRFKSKDGDVVISGGKGGKLPKGFPKDIPSYKGAKVIQSAARDALQFSVALQTDDKVAKVAEYYRSTMKAKGWTEEQVLDMPNRSIQSYTKDGRGAQLMVMQSGEGQTVITLASGPSK